MDQLAVQREMETWDGQVTKEQQGITSYTLLRINRNIGVRGSDKPGPSGHGWLKIGTAHQKRAISVETAAGNHIVHIITDKP
jgi:hypothetical protein